MTVAPEESDHSNKKLTKRQRRKLLQQNPKLKAPHCKNPSPEVRSKVYLRVAGLNDKSKNGKNAQSNSPKNKSDANTDGVSNKGSMNIDYLPSGRLLGGPDASTRHKAVIHLQNYLKARSDVGSAGISELDLLMLWKGLWYTLFLADHVAVQDELSKRLAKLIWCVAGTEERDEAAGQEYLLMKEEQEKHFETLEDEEDEEDDDDEEEEDNEEEDEEEEEEGEEEEADDDDDDESDEDHEGEEADEEMDCEDEESSMTNFAEIKHCRGAHLACLFVQTCFRTIRREWGNVDKYRIDKFYTLMRYVLHEVYRYMALRHWNLGIVRLFNDAILDEILVETPNGPRFHLIDITIEELAKVSHKAPMPLTEATFLDALEPYVFLAQTGAGDKIVQGRVMENIFQRFLDQYSFVSENALSKDNEDKEVDQTKIFEQVHVETVSKFIFEAASDEATYDTHRKSLYDMHKSYMRRLKIVGKDVIIAHQEDDDENDHDNMMIDGNFENLIEAYDGDIEHDNHESTDDELGNLDSSKGGNKKKTQSNKSEDQSKETKKDKKKKKEKKKKNKTDESSNDANMDEENQKENQQDASKKSKKKQKSMKDNSDDDNATSPNKKKDKEKAKKKKSKLKSQDDTGNNEEEITISLSDQRKAINAMQEKSKKAKTNENENDNNNNKNRKRKKKHRGGDDDDNNDTENRRVSFEGKNRFKSYKASMKALRTMDSPSTLKKNPEKGILLNKKAAKTINKNNKKRRKRAVDYF